MRILIFFFNSGNFSAIFLQIFLIFSSNLSSGTPIRCVLNPLNSSPLCLNFPFIICLLKSVLLPRLIFLILSISHHIFLECVCSILIQELYFYLNDYKIVSQKARKSLVGLHLCPVMRSIT